MVWLNEKTRRKLYLHSLSFCLRDSQKSALHLRHPLTGFSRVTSTYSPYPGSGCLRVLLLRQAVCFFLHASLVCFSVSVKIAQMGQSVNSVRTDRRVRRTNRLLFAQRVDSNESLPEGMEVRIRWLTENEAKGYNVARKGYCTRVGIF